MRDVELFAPVVHRVVRSFSEKLLGKVRASFWVRNGSCGLTLSASCWFC